MTGYLQLMIQSRRRCRCLLSSRFVQDVQSSARDWIYVVLIHWFLFGLVCFYVRLFLWCSSKWNISNPLYFSRAHFYLHSLLTTSSSSDLLCCRFLIITLHISPELNTLQIYEILIIKGNQITRFRFTSVSFVSSIGECNLITLTVAAVLLILFLSCQQLLKGTQRFTVLYCSIAIADFTSRLVPRYRFSIRVTCSILIFFNFHVWVFPVCGYSLGETIRGVFRHYCLVHVHRIWLCFNLLVMLQVLILRITAEAIEFNKTWFPCLDQMFAQWFLD